MSDRTPACPEHPRGLRRANRSRSLPFVVALSVLCALAVLVGAGSSARAQAQATAVASPQVPVADAGFESVQVGTHAYQPAGTPWTFGPGAGLAASNSAFLPGRDAWAGSQVAFLQGGGAISQTVTVVDPGWYRVSFRATQRAQNVQQLEVRIAGTVQSVLEPPIDRFDAHHSAAIELAAGQHLIEIVGLNPAGGDNTAMVDAIEFTKALDWNDPASWTGAQMPGAADDVLIPASSQMLLSGTVDAAQVTVNGVLAAHPTADLAMTASWVLSQGDGALVEFGHEHQPASGAVVLTLQGEPGDPEFGGMGTKFLGAMGGQLELHGQPRVSWTKLAAPADIGATTLTLDQAVDWQVGDQIVVTSNRVAADEAEVHELASVNGNTVTLVSGLAHPRLGQLVTETAPDGRTWDIDARVEVGLLTRNVVVQGDQWSEDGGAGFGGHIMAMGDARSRASNVELFRMGQRGELGRYPWHWHLLADRGDGLWLRNSAIHRSYNRAIVVHGTSYTEVSDNVAYDHVGHGVMLEDGAERFNVFTRNLALMTRIPEAGDELTPSDREPLFTLQNSAPSTYWITNPNNIFVDNVAAGSEGTGFWFALPQSPTGSSANDPRLNWMEPYREPLGQFDGNVAHSNLNGLDVNDRLDSNHAIVANGSWDNDGQKVFNDLTFFSNRLGIYVGIGRFGEEQVRYANARFTDNHQALMFATPHIVDDSVFVAAQDGPRIDPGVGIRSVLTVYDGPARIHDSHIVGYDAPDATLLESVGAALKAPNIETQGLTFDHAGPPNIFHNIPMSARFPQSAQLWGNSIRDLDGTLTGTADWFVMPDLPLYETPGVVDHDHWDGYMVSPRGMGLINFIALTTDIPLAVRRTGGGLPDATKVFPQRAHPLHNRTHIPLLVGDDFVHELIIPRAEIESRTSVQMRLQFFPEIGDSMVVRWKGAAGLTGLSMSGATQMSTLAQVQAAPNAAWAVVGDDMVMRLEFTSYPTVVHNLAWTGGALLGVGDDTDGDGFTDDDELVAGTDPLAAGGALYAFDAAQGWTPNADFNATVAGGEIGGTTTGGDAQTIHTGFSFDTADVAGIELVMSSDLPVTLTELFWAGPGQGFAAERRASATVEGDGSRTRVVFDLAGDPDWTGIIEQLRIDPVSQSGVAVAIDHVLLLSPADLAADDTDGDGTDDVDEIAAGRDPDAPDDLAFGFVDTDGWSVIGDLSGFTTEMGQLHTESTGGDPRFSHNGVRFDGDLVPQLAIRLRMSEAGPVQLFWSSGSGFNAGEKLTVQYNQPGVTQTLVFDVGAVPEWYDGTIVGLRLDPGNGAGREIVIDAIGVPGGFPDGSRGDVNCDGITDIVDALFLAQYTVGNRTPGTCPLANPASQLALPLGDVNENTSTDIVDALLISQCTVDMIALCD